MSSAAFVSVVAFLYYLCFLLFGGLLFLFGLRRGHGSRANQELRCAFFILALSIMCWHVTVFLEVRVSLPVAQLWVGRFNFAVGSVIVYYAFRFVQHIPMNGASGPPPLSPWLLAETAVVAGLTLLTPLVDANEISTEGRAISVFGPLFPAYLVHIVVYLACTVAITIKGRTRAKSHRIRSQFALIGFGTLATGCVGVVTNAVLPYSYNNYQYCDVGTLTTLVFIIAVGYATLVKGLFDLRFVLRETLVYGVMLAFVLGAYSSAVFVISQYLTNGADKLTQFSVLLIAFSFDPLRRFLEDKTDRLLFGGHTLDSGSNATKRPRKQALARRGAALGLLFPWRRM